MYLRSAAEGAILSKSGVAQALRRYDSSEVTRGEFASFDELVDDYYARIRVFFLSLSHDDDLALDLTQSTFLAAWQQYDAIVDHPSVGAWLFRVARNEWGTHLRRQRFRRCVPLLETMGSDGISANRMQNESMAQACWQRDLIEQALSRLSPKLRDAFVLRHFAGLSDSEIADVLEISPAASQRRAHRAEQQFRDAYVLLNGGIYLPEDSNDAPSL